MGLTPETLSFEPVDAKPGQRVYVGDVPNDNGSEHYILKAWSIKSGDATREGSGSFIMGTTNVELEFEFVRAYRVTVINDTPAGGSADYQDGHQDFPEGMTVNIGCDANEHYEFSYAYDETEEYIFESLPVSFSMPAQDLTIHVEFGPITWTLDVDNDFEFGEYIANPEPQFGDDMYLDGTSVTITAYPYSEFELDSFVVNGSSRSGSGNSITVTMTQDTTVEIHYAERPWYNVTTNVIPAVASIEISGDWVEPTDFGAECLSGTAVTVSAPEIVEGAGVFYRFNHFTVGGEEKPQGQNSVTFTVNADTSVVAYYDQVYRLEIDADTPSAWGSVSPDYGTHYYALGASVTISLSPATGYQLTGSQVATEGSIVWHDGSESSYTITMTGNTSLTVVWGEIPKYPVTVTITPAGSGSCSMASGDYEAGSYTVTATAADAYEFGSMTINEVAYGNPATITLGGEGANIVINFVKKRYTLTINPSEHGYLTPDPTPNNGFYEHGQSITLEPHPDENYQQSSLSINGATVSSNTFTITQNTTVSATFSRVYQIIITSDLEGIASIVSTPEGPLPSGSTFTVTVTAASDYVLDSVTVDGITDPSCAGQSSFSRTYTMGDHDVYISATGHQVIFHVYSYEGAQASPTSGPKNTTINVTVPPDSNAMYGGAYVTNLADGTEFDITGATTDDDGTVHFSFTLPEGDVEIHISWLV